MTTIAPPPAEWAPHSAVWIGFPSHADLWVEDLEPAREEVVAFARAVHAEGRGEKVILVAADAEAGDTAMTMAPFAEVVVEPFTLIVVVQESGGQSAVVVAVGVSFTCVAVVSTVDV